MITKQHVKLSSLTTFRVGGEAQVVATCAGVEEVHEALAYAREQHLRFYVLGEGSNVLASDAGYTGLIIRIDIPGLTFEEEEENVNVRVGAGVSWDELVEETAKRGLWGVENLAGIPGLVGAAPVQNIGAYGAELKDTLKSVEVIDAKTGKEMRLTSEECKLSYRDSTFKHNSSLIITSVTLTLQKQGLPRIEYGDLLRAKEAGIDLSTPLAISVAVRQIRSGKFPDRTRFGTAGSFFKNPILTKETYDALCSKYGPIPQFPNPKGVKIPLAFILDKVLGLRGYRKGAAWLFGAQPLVLVLDEGGTARDVDSLAREIEVRVKEETNIIIEREVRSMPQK